MRTDTIVAITVAFTFGVLVDQEFNDPLKHGCLPFPDDHKIQSAPPAGMILNGTVSAPNLVPLSAQACAHAVAIGQPWRCT